MSSCLKSTMQSIFVRVNLFSFFLNISSPPIADIYRYIYFKIVSFILFPGSPTKGSPSLPLWYSHSYLPRVWGTGDGHFCCPAQFSPPHPGRTWLEQFSSRCGDVNKCHWKPCSTSMMANSGRGAWISNKIFVFPLDLCRQERVRKRFCISKCKP